MSTPAATNTVLTLGVQGPPGVGALSTTLTGSITQPAVGSTVAASVVSPSGAVIGGYVNVAGLGALLITAISGSTLTLQNTGATGNAAPGTLCSGTLAIASCGPPGPTGPQGPAGGGGGSPTGTGVALVSGGAFVSAAGPVPLNGGASYVSGTLPAANQAAQTMAGAVGGTTAASTINLTGNANITGVLPAANGGFAAGGDLSGTGTAQQVNGANPPSSALTTAPNFTITTPSSTASPGTPGSFQVVIPLPTGAGAEGNVAFYRGSVSTTTYVGGWDAHASYLNFYALLPGSTKTNNNYFLQTDGANVYLNAPANNGTMYIGMGNAANYFSVSNQMIQAGVPILGLPGDSSPYGVHGDVTTAITATSALTAAQYAQGLIRVTPAAAMTLSGFPLAATAQGYPKEILIGAAFAVTLSDGTHTKTLPAINGLYRVCFTAAGIYGGNTAL